MSESLLITLWITLKVATFSTLLVFIPGVLLGFYFERTHSRFAKFLSAVTILPMVIPPTAVGFILLKLFGYDGILGTWLSAMDIEILLTWKAAVIASAVMAFPIMVRTSKVAFEGVDQKLEAMARTLGYSRVQAFFKVALPLAFRGLLAAAILSFTRAVGEFGATVTVAGNIYGKTQTLSSAIYTAEQVGKENEAMVLIIISLALGFFAIFMTEMLSKKSSKYMRN
ncbi:MAG: molybdate ABC transporter permease subunit [Bdellovibrionota bacterium]|nr:molybdate ABC transporter permease subunit [Deltaproteobacteria bacterium]